MQKKSPHLAMMGASRGFSPAAAPVSDFSRGTTGSSESPPGDPGPLPPAEPRLARVGLSLPSTRDGDTQGWLTRAQPSLCCFSKAQRGPIRCTRLHPPPPPHTLQLHLPLLLCSINTTLTLGTEWGPGGELLKLQWGAGVQAGCLAVDEPRAGARGGGLVES